jgi:hypothetical protein
MPRSENRRNDCRNAGEGSAVGELGQLWVTFRPHLSIEQGSIVSPQVFHEVTVRPLRLSNLVPFGAQLPLGPSQPALGSDVDWTTMATMARAEEGC